MAKNMSHSEDTNYQIHYRDLQQQGFKHQLNIHAPQGIPYIDQRSNNSFTLPNQMGIPKLPGECRNYSKDPSYACRKPRARNERSLPRSVPLSSVRPGDVRPSDAQLDVAYAYGIRRHDGSITRLIRADHINTPLMNPRLPRWQAEEGLIILPHPRQLSPDSRGGIDPIIPQHKIRELNQSTTPNMLRTSARDSNQIQHQIDTITSTRTKESESTTQRRKKVYCDKWVHEGVCAFTQVGCKFKHEMPTDRKTQIAVGLNHGFPNWYRRACGQKMSLYSEPILNHNQSRATDDTWRYQPNTISHHFPLTPGKSTSRTAFGPIRPPVVPSRIKNNSPMNKDDAKLDLYDV
ncbi:putative c-x8-c-x5-c-x3-h type zinc finger protein [Erysiphe neolycopersici]|uniref:Putative c-x8-c-x5-c-x3-h type zinc finger protein n=1 Tax=Erysiphe neolycopersici TaxID=212602 RepID=A0A420HW28_9PEZI|nr:putative c-x8-c-x5-c-x3-h type zinc finger protein [Erysiphe neolycopersici]